MGPRNEKNCRKQQVGGIVEGTTSHKKPLRNGLPMHRLRQRQLCVRKDEGEERDEPLLPRGAVKVSVREVLLDLRQEVPARSTVSNMVTS